MTKNLFASIMLTAIIILASGCQQETNTDSEHIAETKDKNQTSTENNQKIETIENEAFKIIAPVSNQQVNGSFLLKGKARVFEAVFQYKLEDDQQHVLAEGYIMADKGAPEWGEFEMEIPFKETTRSKAILTIYEESAKDGSPQHELFIPLNIKHKK